MSISSVYSSDAVTVWLQEFEEKAPVIKKQKADYEEAVNIIERCTQQLTAALKVCASTLCDAQPLQHLFAS